MAESVEDLLRKMLASASAAVTELRGKFDIMANQRKFHALPDELLAIIFEMACQHSPSDGSKSVCKLSLVSRRFRRIVLRLPILWSSISLPDQHINKAKLFASRATTPTISLSIEGICTDDQRPQESEHARIIAMYQLAVSISSRIKTMSIRLRDSDIPHLQQIHQTCSHISLPSLVDLSLDADCSNDNRRKCKTLCRDWDMPSLRKLNLENFLPELRSDVLSKIETCYVEANTGKSVSQGYWRTIEIIEFLQSMVSVKDLCVDVGLIDNYQEPEEGITMESVQNLTLVLWNTKVGMQVNILYFVKFPSITSFKVNLGLKEILDLDDALQDITFRVPPKLVTDVALTFCSEYEPCEEALPTYIIGEWCETFRGLKSVTLESERENTHGLFAFAGSIDALKVINLDNEMCGEILANIPGMWDRPHRTIILDADDVGRTGHLHKVKFIDRR